MSIRPSVAAIAALDFSAVRRVPGTAVLVFPHGVVDVAAVRQFIAAHHQLPERLVVARVVPSLAAHVPVERQASTVCAAPGLYLTTIRFGLDDRPDMPRALAQGSHPVPLCQDVTFYVSPERACAAVLDRMPAWQRWLFTRLARHSESVGSYFRIPSDCIAQLA